MLVELLTSAVAFVLVLWSMWLFGTKTSYKDRHVVVIGGSTGIGLAIAKQLISRGAHITLVARRQPVLETAVNELMQHVQPGDRPPRVYVCSMDITDTDQLKSGFSRITANMGPVDVLVCSAGFATPGFAGYTSYAPSKWALRGFADCLRNELLGTGVKVSIGYPPDTDTPGYAEENLTKPPETLKISRLLQTSVFKPEQVAEQIVKGMERGRYHLPSPDFGLNLMVCAGAALSPHPVPLLLEMVTAPFVAVALYIVGRLVDRAVPAARSAETAA